MAVREFPVVALTNYHKLGGLKQQKCAPENPGAQESEIKALPETAFFTDSPRGECLTISSSFWLAQALAHGCLNLLSAFACM